MTLVCSSGATSLGWSSNISLLTLFKVLDFSVCASFFNREANYLDVTEAQLSIICYKWASTEFPWSTPVFKYLHFIRKRGILVLGQWCWVASKGILVLCASTSVLNQTHGPHPTMPDDCAVVDLLNHSTYRLEKNSSANLLSPFQVNITVPWAVFHIC